MGAHLREWWLQCAFCGGVGAALDPFTESEAVTKHESSNDGATLRWGLTGCGAEMVD